MTINPFEEKSCIGKVTRITKTAAEILLSSEGGNVGGKVGSYVVFECAETAVFGQIADIHNETVAVAAGEKPDLRAVAAVTLLTTIDLSSGVVLPGITQYPNVNSNAFLAHPLLVKLVIQSDRHLKNGKSNILLSLGQLSYYDKTPIQFSPERVFGAHCAILGSSGSGKSWTVARLVGECSRHKSKVILFDASGEYHNMQSGVRHIHIGGDPDESKGGEEASIPYYELEENDLFSIFKPAGESQAPKLKAAMRSLKLAELSPGIALEGLIYKAHKSRQEYDRQYQNYCKEVESSSTNFDITKLTQQIENECVNPYRSLTETGVWGMPNSSDYASCVPLINRIEDIISAPGMAAIFRPGNKISLLKVIRGFLGSRDQNVLRISLKDLPFSYQVREIVANAIGRYLMLLARVHTFRKMPLLIVLDEAHQFLNRSATDSYSGFQPDAFALMAKEGRKYSINICLATQRPNDIPEDVLSQMGTFIVHRLTNCRDRSIIERASGSIDRSTVEAIPALAPGEAIVFGVDFPIPMFMKISEPADKPESRGPDFQHNWAG